MIIALSSLTTRKKIHEFNKELRIINNKNLLKKWQRIQQQKDEQTTMSPHCCENNTLLFYPYRFHHYLCIYFYQL